MAQKVNPVAVRLYLNRYFNSSWFSDYYYTQLLSQDYFLRDYFQKICSPDPLRTTLYNVLGIKNKSLHSQSFSLRIGQCIIHRYSKKVVVHIFYLLPNYRSFGSDTEQVRKLLPRLTKAAGSLEWGKSYELPVRNITSLVSQIAHIDTMSPNLVNNLGRPGSNMPNLQKATFFRPRLSNRNLKHDYFPINMPASCLPDIVLLMNTMPTFQLRRLNVNLDVPLQKPYFCRTKISRFARETRRTRFPASAPTAHIIRSSGLAPRTKTSRFAQLALRKFGALIQSWINIDWFILRYLFLQKYLINTCYFARYAPLINFINLFHQKFQVSVVNQSLIRFAPAASRLPVLSVRIFQSSKQLNIRKSHYTQIENALTKKLSPKNEKDTARLLLRCVPAAPVAHGIHGSSFASNYVKIIPVRSTSIFQSASLLAEEICLQLIQKQSFVKIWKNIFRSLNKQKPKIIKGVRISCSGRLNGAEIAKRENRQWGETSLHVFQNKIDYAMQHALSPYGILGIKVWISYSE